MAPNILEALAYRGSHINSQLDGTAWVGHSQFAYWIVSALQPKVIVELGTHGGCSYFSFCDSVLHNHINAKAFAVDTWEGEQQAGVYGQSVYEKVQIYNQQMFGDFSQLLKMRFDEALPLFSNCSVDLLHIDGFHTYEAASHDLNSWLPKLSENAVVLLHDTHEIAPGFGVHTLWAELKEQNPQKCMEFPHSHGLGIYFPNSDEAAENLRIALGMDLSKAFYLFTVCGDFTYCEINGKSLMQKQTVFDLSQIAELLSQVKTQNPPVAQRLKSLL